MIGIAVVLLLIVIVFSAAVVVSNPTASDLSLFSVNVGVTTAGLYLTGAGAMLVFVLAAALLRRGVKRDRARRRQVRALQKAAGVKSLPTPARRPATSQQAAPASEPVATASATPATASATAAASRPEKASQEGPNAVAPRGDDRQTQHPTPAFRSQGGKPEQTSEPTNSEVAERQALLDEADELTGDSPDR